MVEQQRSEPNTPKKRLQQAADVARRIREHTTQSQTLIDRKFIPIFNPSDKEVAYIPRDNVMEIPSIFHTATAIPPLEIWAIPPFQESFDDVKDISYAHIDLEKKK